jgi:hypothetical protein
VDFDGRGGVLDPVRNASRAVAVPCGPISAMQGAERTSTASASAELSAVSQAWTDRMGCVRGISRVAGVQTGTLDAFMDRTFEL